MVCAACLGVSYGTLHLAKLPESRRGYFIKKPRPKIVKEEIPPVIKQLYKDWKLVDRYHKSVKCTQNWIDRLAWLKEETDPEITVRMIEKFWGNPYRARIARQRKRKGLVDNRKALADFLAQINREDGFA